MKIHLAWIRWSATAAGCGGTSGTCIENRPGRGDEHCHGTARDCTRWHRPGAEPDTGALTLPNHIDHKQLSA